MSWKSFNFASNSYVMDKVQVRLRAMEPTDVEMMYRLENDTAVWPAGCTSAPYSYNALLSFVQHNRNDVFADGQLRMVIDADGKPAGCADLCNVDALNMHAEVSMGILPDFRGCGVGQEAMNQLVDYATELLGLRSLVGIVDQTNTACQRMMEQAGFVRQGVLKAWIRNKHEYNDAIIYQYVSR